VRSPQTSPGGVYGSSEKRWRADLHVFCVIRIRCWCALIVCGGHEARCGVESGHRRGRTPKDEWALNYTDRLRHLALQDAQFVHDCVGECLAGPQGLDPRTLALTRLAALVAVGGVGPSYGAQTDASVDAGATATEIVDVLVGVIPVVGLPLVVAAARQVALALGYDIDEALEQLSDD
jgi:4-carboxymuconolactone decarboxylase